MDPYIGTIQFFGFNFAPRGWAICDGSLYSVQQHTPLFALIGAQYGGNGTTTFALPDLRGRFPMGQGTGPHLTPRAMGDSDGVENVTLTLNQMPHHTHLVNTAGSPTTKSPNGSLPAVSTGGAAYGADPAAQMSPNMLQPAGANQAHTNMPPFVVGNWCIALTGIFPPRD